MTTSTPLSPKPKRRWLRFSLRTLLVVMLLLGCGLGWVGMQLQQKRRHEAVAKEIERLGGAVYEPISSDQYIDQYDTTIPTWKKWLFGVYAVKQFTVALNNTSATDSLLAQIKGINCGTLIVIDDKWSGAGLIHLKGMPHLYQLHLHDTQLTDTGLAHLKGMTSLTWLQLNRTQITDAGLTNLKEMTRLKYLELNGTQITDAGLAHLKGMTSLEVLELNGTQITDAGLTHLKGMTSLHWLKLDDTEITDAGLESLQELNSLRGLHLESTGVTRQGIYRLQKALPDCEISY